MGFLKNFSEPFAFALALWPFVSMLLTVTREQRMKLPWQSAQLKIPIPPTLNLCYILNQNRHNNWLFCYKGERK